MKTILIVFLLSAAGVAAAESDADFLRQKYIEWFSQAKSATKSIFVTDAKGCLFSVYDPGNGIQLIQMLNEQKKPVCRK